jgi:hypothetical protein
MLPINMSTNYVDLFAIPYRTRTQPYTDFPQQFES